MGGGNSKVIYQIDECRPVVMETAMDFRIDALRTNDECRRKKTAKAWMDYQHLMSKETRTALVDEIRKVKERLKLDQRFCRNIEKTGLSTKYRSEKLFQKYLFDFSEKIFLKYFLFSKKSKRYIFVKISSR